MSLEDLGNIGEFVAAVAVVLSLIYLAVQIRQNTRQVDVNTKALQRSALDQATQLWSRFRDPMIRDRALAELYLTGLHDADALDRPDLFRFRQLLMDLFLGFLSVYLQSEDSDFSKEAWDAHVPLLRSLLNYPGVAAWWDTIHDTGGLHPSFVAQVDAIRASAAKGGQSKSEQFLQG
jgi:hypothetical protein